MDIPVKKIKKILNTLNKLENGEFEVRLTNEIERYDFERILNKLIFNMERGGIGLNFTKSSELDILYEVKPSNKMQKINERTTIVGNNNIKKYWLDNILCEETYKIIYKERKEILDIKKYNLRIALCEEKKKDILNIKNKKGGIKTFRFKNRFSITSLDGIFRFDLTSVKMSKGESFKSARTLEKVPKYEIEMELIDNTLEQDDIINSLVANIGLILQLYYKTDILIDKGESEKVLVEYKKMIMKANTDKKLKFDITKNKFFFVAANPITLQVENFIETKGNYNILKNYAITYKADGERNFIFLNEKGELYFINNNFLIRKTGIMNKKWANTLIEGEYIYDKRLYLGYDMLFSRGKDIRNHFLRKNKKKDIDGRLDELIICIKDINREKGDTILSIIMKPYEFRNTGENLFKNIKKMWNNRKNIEWNVDGILFVPIWESYPNRSMSWNKLFKWKPRDTNSIDFLIKDTKDIKSTVVANNVIQYKEFKLKITGGSQVYNSNNWNRVAKPIDFSPEGEPIIAKIPIESDGRVYLYDGSKKEEIADNTIVEFVYFSDEKNFKWKPIRVRHDKTDRYKSGEKYFGNYEKVALSIWKSMSNEITESIITSGIVPEYLIQKLSSEVYYDKNMSSKMDGGDGGDVDNIGKEKQNSYYVKDLSNKFENKKKNSLPYKRLPYQNFHNIVVKRELMNKTVNRDGLRLLDLCSGRGGDIGKWKEHNFSEVVGIELYKAGVNAAKMRVKGNKPKITFLQGDSGKLMFPEYDIGSDLPTKKILKELIPSKYSFDIVSCQFAIHYLYLNEEIFDNFLQNVSDNLKIGGYFIGTSFDGKRLFNSLKGKKILDGEDAGWKITKKYMIDDYDEKEPNYGLLIGVDVHSFSREQEEPLFNFSYFEKKMKERGFEKVMIEGFANIYENEKEKNNYTFLKDMSEKEKEFSFYNNSFVFKKNGNKEEDNKTNTSISNNENNITNNNKNKLIKNISKNEENEVLTNDNEENKNNDESDIKIIELI